MSESIVVVWLLRRVHSFFDNVLAITKVSPSLFILYSAATFEIAEDCVAHIMRYIVIRNCGAMVTL